MREINQIRHPNSLSARVTHVEATPTLSGEISRDSHEGLKLVACRCLALTRLGEGIVPLAERGPPDGRQTKTWPSLLHPGANARRPAAMRRGLAPGGWIRYASTLLYSPYGGRQVAFRAPVDVNPGNRQH